MKKTVQYLAVAAALAAAGGGSAFGSVIFRWYPSSGSLTNNAGSPITSPNATVLTYVSGDEIIDFAYDGVLKDTYGTGAGADTFYTNKNNTLSGRYSTGYMTNLTDTISGKFAYSIVLDYPNASFTTLDAVPVGTYYGVTTIGKTNGVNKALATYNALDPNTIQSLSGGNVKTTLQVIPEPSALAMVGLGVGAVALRRRLRKNKTQA
jgi:hypothetical protein